MVISAMIHSVVKSPSNNSIVFNPLNMAVFSAFLKASKVDKLPTLWIIVALRVVLRAIFRENKTKPGKQFNFYDL